MFCASVFLSLFALENLQAQPLAVTAQVEKTIVYVGEPFTFQINVQGDDAPAEPVIKCFDGISVSSLGGQQNSRSSITIVNGRMSQIVERGFVFSYQLTAQRAGILTIPSIPVSVSGNTLQTNNIQIQARVPQESEDFKLKLNFSEDVVYVGQAVTLSVVWYISKDVHEFDFNLPLLSDSRFNFADIPKKIDQQNRDSYLAIKLPGGELIAEKGRDIDQGREFVTISFQKLVIPKVAGNFTFPQSTVSLKAVSGYQGGAQRSDPFDALFGDDPFFGSRRRAVYQQFVIPSNTPKLEVRALPLENKPKNFSGLVGKFNIFTTATPTQVNVGDPITLNIKVTGPAYLEQVELPPLDKQANLVKDFRIPSEMASGKVEGRIKTFSQTLRARSDKVKVIPALELSYFDVEKGDYQIAKSREIPLQVSATRVVTARDAEGEVVEPENKQNVEVWTSGIMHNYTDDSLLVSQEVTGESILNSRSTLSLLIGPPLIYTVLFIAVYLRRHRNPEADKAKRALKQFNLGLDQQKININGNPEVVSASVIENFKVYFGNRLGLAAGALTYKDLKTVLEKYQVSSALQDDLKRIFDQCEASRYAGASQNNEELSKLISEAKKIGALLERELSK